MRHRGSFKDKREVLTFQGMPIINYITMRTTTTVPTTVTSKGQVTIPLKIRRYLGIKPKDRVRFTIGKDGSVSIIPTRSHVRAVFGSVEPLQQPEDSRALRREFEDGVAENVLRRGKLEEEAA